MLIIKPDQLRVFEAALSENFVRRAHAHVQQFFPGVTERVGAANMPKIIQATIARAAEYGISSEQDICTFLDLAIAFGWNFDRERAWAVKCLSEPGYGEPATRVNLLFAAALVQAELSANAVALPAAVQRNTL